MKYRFKDKYNRKKKKQCIINIFFEISKLEPIYDKYNIETIDKDFSILDHIRDDVCISKHRLSRY